MIFRRSNCHFSPRWPTARTRASASSGCASPPTISRSPRRRRRSARATIAAAIHALSQADEASRSAFARRLAPHSAAADALEALAALGGEAALVALTYAVALPRERLSAAASGEASAPARAVAQRADLDAALIDALIARDEADTALTLARNDHAPIDAAQFAVLARRAQENPADPRLTNALLERTPATIEQGALFFEASPAQRVRIVGAAQRATLGRRYPAAHSPVAASVAARLERSALDSDWRRFEAALAEEFGCPASLAARIASDPGGEPLAVGAGRAWRAGRRECAHSRRARPA